MQRLVPPRLVMLLLIVMVFLSWFLPIWGPPEGAGLVITVAAGAAIAVAGAALTVVGSRRFAAIGTNIETFKAPEVFVTSAPFGFSRNPMYLGFAVLLLGVAVGLGVATAFVGPVVFFLAADRWYIPFEENRMAENFGESYKRYCTTVRRWIGTRS